jgi:hypothetical protein
LFWNRYIKDAYQNLELRYVLKMKFPETVPREGAQSPSLDEECVSS